MKDGEQLELPFEEFKKSSEWDEKKKKSEETLKRIRETRTNEIGVDDLMSIMGIDVIDHRKKKE